MESNTCSSWVQQNIFEYQYLFPDPSNAFSEHNLFFCRGVNADTCELVEAVTAFGLAPEHIYFSKPEKTEEEIQRTFGKCQFVANSWDELQRIGWLACFHKREELLEPVGLRVIPVRYGDGNQPGISEKLFSELAQKIKTLPAITVRGCFVQGNIGGLYGDALGGYFRECCELAKRITVTLPCAMPYLCILGGAAAAHQNAAEHPETLETFLRHAKIVAMQNRTAFYAKLLIT